MPASFTQGIQHFLPDMLMLFLVFRQTILSNFELETNAFHLHNSYHKAFFYR
jgi:hypothetical protein